MRLDKENTQRSNMNSKYLSVRLVVKYPDCLFLLCSISLLVKYDLILRYEAGVKALRVSSCLKPVYFLAGLFALDSFTSTSSVLTPSRKYF